MSGNAERIVAELKAHIDAQERARAHARESGEEYRPSDQDKAERDRLMSRFLAAVGLSKFEMQRRLGVDRATWDRWRAMTSLPHRAHIGTLERIARRESENESDSASDEETILPQDMLSDSPHTWGRLRLMYSFYKWDNAVFGFTTPFTDQRTCTEMALLALRGCELIYIISSPAEWFTEFRNNVQSVLGKMYTARVMSRLAIIQEDFSQINDALNFGIFNYESESPKWTAAYKWIGNEDDTPNDSTENLYKVIRPSDDLFIEIKKRFGEQITKARNNINERSVPNFNSPPDIDTIDSLLNNIPIIN